MVKPGSDGVSRREAGRPGNIKDVFASKTVSSYKTPRGAEDKLTATNKQTKARTMLEDMERTGWQHV